MCANGVIVSIRGVAARELLFYDDSVISLVIYTYIYTHPIYTAPMITSGKMYIFQRPFRDERSDLFVNDSNLELHAYIALFVARVRISRVAAHKARSIYI